MTYKDLTVGVPACLSCIEQVFFAAFFYYTFRSNEYVLRNKEGSVQPYTMGRAIGDALNPSDLLRGIVAAFGFFGRKKTFEAR